MENHSNVFKKRKNKLIKTARSVAEQAVSYRNFLVGCAILAYNSKKKKYSIFTGVNLKPVDGGPKVCAEAVAIGSAISQGFSEIIAIAIAGEPQTDDDSGLKTSTLHPCWACRRLLEALPQVSQDIIILTAHNHGGMVEKSSLIEIIKLHDQHTT